MESCPEESLRLTVAEEVEARTNKLCDMSIIVVGGGFAGIATAKAMRCRGANVTVLERQENIGGVWAFNEYPGIALQATTCSYSFLPFLIPAPFSQAPKELYEFPDMPFDHKAARHPDRKEADDRHPVALQCPRT